MRVWWLQKWATVRGLPEAWTAIVVTADARHFVVHVLATATGGWSTGPVYENDTRIANAYEAERAASHARRAVEREVAERDALWGTA